MLSLLTNWQIRRRGIQITQFIHLTSKDWHIPGFSSYILKYFVLLSINRIVIALNVRREVTQQKCSFCLIIYTLVITCKLAQCAYTCQLLIFKILLYIIIFISPYTPAAIVWSQLESLQQVRATTFVPRAPVLNAQSGSACTLPHSICPLLISNIPMCRLQKLNIYSLFIKLLIILQLITMPC